tara:strand:- start:1369 stop:1656 length:288 start_codon:yes stop_codon:yes gene_type:complete
MAGLRDREAPIGEYRNREHLWSRIKAPFDGSPDSIPYEVGDKYEERPILAIGVTKNVYGKRYYLIVQGDKTHARNRFEFDEKHDLISTKFLKYEV